MRETKAFRSVWVVFAAVVGLALGGQTGLLHGDGLVPYRGVVEGVLLIDATGAVTAPPATKTSSYLGRGIQIYEQFDMSPTAHGLRAVGRSRSIAANGDELCIAFVIEGRFTKTGDLVYVGDYKILCDGTGRFAYDPALTNLGSGTMAGVGLVTTDPNTWVTQIEFRHLFSGTLRLDTRAK
jgi:hypothetical protein